MAAAEAELIWFLTQGPLDLPTSWSALVNQACFGAAHTSGSPPVSDASLGWGRHRGSGGTLERHRRLERRWRRLSVENRAILRCRFGASPVAIPANLVAAHGRELGAVVYALSLEHHRPGHRRRVAQAAVGAALGAWERTREASTGQAGPRGPAQAGGVFPATSPESR